MSFQSDIVIIKHKIIDWVLLATAIYVLLPLSTSVLRAFTIGWSPIYFMHISIAFSLYLLFFFRKKLSLSVKSHSFLILYLVVSLAGVITFKTISGFYYIAVVVVISTILFGFRTGLFYTLFFLTLYGLIAYLHIQNILGSTINFEQYANATATWITQATGIIYVVVIILYALSLYYRLFTESINNSVQKNKELEQALTKIKLEEQRFLNVVESSNDGYLFVDENFTITYVNNSFEELSGYDKKEIIGKDYKKWLQERYDDWEDYYETLLKAINKPKETLYTDIADKSGNRNPVEINLYKSDEPNNKYIWGVVKDLREIKSLERQVYSTMVWAEEKERERYAKELHDGMGPLLSTSMIYMNTIIEDSKLITIKDFAQRAFDLLKESTQTIKEISNNLSPLILRDYGAVQAVRSFIEKAQNSNKIKFKIIDTTTNRFSEITEITLYRTLIELINNSLKYSKAQNITVAFTCNHGLLSVTYTDDGVGFDYKKTIENKQGYGLMNMESRIKKIGGKYEYTSAPGKGVKVAINLNVKCV